MADPTTTTTATPSTTTTAPSTTTTTAPSTTTTAPSTTTTTAPSTTTTSAQPSIEEFTGAPKSDDGLTHSPESLQVVVETPVVLSWTVSNAPDGVELTGPDGTQRFDAGTTSTDVTPKEETQDYELVALAGDVRSDLKTVHVSTHPHGHVYSPHATVQAPGAPAKIEKFVVYASEGGTLDEATETVSVASGAKVKLHVEVSGEVDSATIDNGAPDLSLDDEGMGEVEVTPGFGQDGTEVVYTLNVAPSNPNEEPQTAAVHVTQRSLPASATLQISAGGQSAADGGEDVQVAAGDPISLHWKVTSAASALLTADFKPGELVADGVIGEGGELMLHVALNRSVPALLRMVDDDGNDLATWELDIEPPEKPAATNEEAPANFESLLAAGANLKLDDSGNGEGDLTLDPGPGQSAIFTLAVTPKDEQQGSQGAKVTATVSNSFCVLLQMPDGTPAPAGRKCKLGPLLLADNEGGPDSSSATV